MSVEIRDIKQPPEMPSPKSLRVGEVTGQVKPWVCQDQLYWRAALRPGGGRYTGLMQGTARSVSAALVAMVISERRDLAHRSRVLAQIEAELGTAGQSDDELLAVDGIVRDFC